MPNADQVLSNTNNYDTLIRKHVIRGVYVFADSQRDMEISFVSEDYNITVSEINGVKYANEAEIKGNITADNGCIYIIASVLL